MLNGAVSLTVLQRPASLFRQSEARTSRPHGGTRLWKCPSEKMGAGGGRRHSPRHQSLLVLLPAVRSQKMRLLPPPQCDFCPLLLPQSLAGSRPRSCLAREQGIHDASESRTRQGSRVSEMHLAAYNHA